MYLPEQRITSKMFKRPANTKVWRILKDNTIDPAKHLENFVNKIYKEDWITGYKRWQKTNQKLKDRTPK